MRELLADLAYIEGYAKTLQEALKGKGHSWPLKAQVGLAQRMYELSGIALGKLSVQAKEGAP